MPLLDPGVVISSPFLGGRFRVRRRALVIGGNGRASSVDAVVCVAAGVITPKGDNGTTRDEKGSNATSTFSVVTRYPLRKQANGIEPDQVLWRGMELLVVDVEDYLDFGPGWVEATCTSDQIAELPVGRR